MTLHLRLHHAALRTAGDESRYEFKAGVNSVIGSYATGKSSLFELIKYGLGGSGEIMPLIRANLREVEIEATVGATRLRLVRKVGRNRVAVHDPVDGSQMDDWPTKGADKAGERLLELLGVPSARLSRRSASGATSEALSFFDLYRYCYVPQNDIDRSVAGHKDPFVNRKRRAVFEMAFGLTDDRLRELRVEAGELEQQRGLAVAEAATVRRFLVQTGAVAAEELDDEETLARAALAAADDRLAVVRVAPSTADQELLRARVRALRQAAADADAEASAAGAAVARDRAVLSQLALDEARAARAQAASASLTGLEFTTCPRCLQALTSRRVDDGHCLLCTLPQAAPARTVGDAAQRLREQRDEAELILAEDVDRAGAAAARLDAARTALDEAVSELESSAARPGEPVIDAVAEASAERERARARLREIERFRDLWDGYRARVDMLAAIDAQLVENKAEQVRQSAELEANRRRVDEFSERFDEEMRELHYAGYTHAEIDPTTYLPSVNDDAFDKLSVGGARKTLASVGYFIALLGYTLSSQEIALPDLLLLDSPRKNLGNTPDDTAAGVRIYYRLGLLAQAYPQAQILLADNGLPSLDPQTLRRMNVISLTYDRALLRDVQHPGEGGVETIGAGA